MLSAIIKALTSFFIGVAATTPHIYVPPANQSAIYVVRPSVVKVSTPAPSPTTTTTSSSISDTSSNWAGYAASGSSFTNVSGSWVIPTVTASSGTAADAAWIGIGGVASNDLIQVGTQSVVSADGQVSSSAFYETLPATSQNISSISVHPGDTINASINEAGTDEWTISLKDATDGEAYTGTVYYASSESSAEWIEEDPTSTVGEIPFDSFGSISFSAGSAIENGNTVNLQSSDARAITLLNTEWQTLATPSALSSNGSSFSVTRSSVSSTSSTPSYTANPDGWHRQGSGIGSLRSSYTPSTSSNLGSARRHFDQESYKTLSF